MCEPHGQQTDNNKLWYGTDEDELSENPECNL